MKLSRSMIPVLLSLLMVLLASPSVQAYSTYFYVIPTSAPLRECASPGCEVLHTVYQGDKVEILERTGMGWSKVRLVDRPTGIGWIPSDWLSYSPDRKTVGFTHLSCQYQQYSPDGTLPGRKRGVLTMLHLNDPVEMLGVGTSGWAQVRDPEEQPGGLGRTPISVPRHRRIIQPPTPRRRAPARKAPPKEEQLPPNPVRCEFSSPEDARTRRAPWVRGKSAAIPSS